jgi:hypothetical protein
MSRGARHGRGTPEQRLDEALHALKLTHATLAHLEAEHDRYRLALRRIAAAESGIWGTIAHDALRAPELAHLEDNPA